MQKIVNRYDPDTGLITRWVADNTARRVPLFVTAVTKLSTVVKVRAKYGYGAAWEKDAKGKVKLIRKGVPEKVKAVKRKAVKPAPKKAVKAKAKPTKRPAPKKPTRVRKPKAKRPAMDVNPVLAAVIP